MWSSGGKLLSHDLLKFHQNFVGTTHGPFGVLQASGCAFECLYIVRSSHGQVHCFLSARQTRELKFGAMEGSHMGIARISVKWYQKKASGAPLGCSGLLPTWARLGC
jgi:hypothetical protein